MKKVLVASLLFFLVFCCACNINEAPTEESNSAQTTSVQNELDTGDGSPKKHNITRIIPADQFADFWTGEAEDFPNFLSPEEVDLFNGELQKVVVRRSFDIGEDRHEENFYSYVFSAMDKRIVIEYSKPGWSWNINGSEDFFDTDLSYCSQYVTGVKIGKATYLYGHERLDEIVPVALNSIGFDVGDWTVLITFEEGLPIDHPLSQQLLNKETAPAQIDELIALFEELLSQENISE